MAKILFPNKSAKANVQWAKDYYLSNLKTSESVNLNFQTATNGTSSKNSKRQNLKKTNWDNAATGKTTVYDFVEVPLVYTNKISPSVNLSRGISAQAIDKSVFNASFDRLIIYKDVGGNIDQRIVSFIPDKDYLDRHNGNVGHNKIDKLDNDFFGYLHYKDWNGSNLFMLRIENGKSVRHYSLDNSNSQNNQQSGTAIQSTTRTENAPGENCLTLTTTYYITWCYYTDENTYPDYCDPPEQIAQTTQNICDNGGGGGSTTTNTVDCSDPLNFSNAKCLSIEDKNPCDEKTRISAIKSSAAFNSQDSIIRDNIYYYSAEYGGEYKLSSLSATSYKSTAVRTGLQNKFEPSFTWNATDGFTLGDGHSHPGGTAPSPADAFGMAKNLSNSELKNAGKSDIEFYKSNCFMKIITDSATYMVTVKNWSKYLTEYQNYKTQGYLAYTADFLTIGGTGFKEPGFRFLKQFGDFLTIYKADLNGNFKPLMLKTENGQEIVGVRLCPGDIQPGNEE
jgi:hypothetical protein